MGGDDQATGMAYNATSPSSTAPTIAPSSIHTFPKLVKTPSTVVPAIIEVIQTIQTSRAYACIIEECPNWVSSEYTICEACHDHATMMFREMRKFVSLSLSLTSTSFFFLPFFLPLFLCFFLYPISSPFEFSAWKTSRLDSNWCY